MTDTPSLVYELVLELPLNPLSPNSDQHQFSPNNIYTLSRDKVMRIYEMITKEKMLRSAVKFSQLILLGNVWRSVWRICMWILGLKGLTGCDCTTMIERTSPPKAVSPQKWRYFPAFFSQARRARHACCGWLAFHRRACLGLRHSFALVFARL